MPLVNTLALLDARGASRPMCEQVASDEGDN